MKRHRFVAFCRLFATTNSLDNLVVEVRDRQAGHCVRCRACAALRQLVVRDSPDADGALHPSLQDIQHFGLGHAFEHLGRNARAEERGRELFVSDQVERLVRIVEVLQVEGNVKIFLAFRRAAARSARAVLDDAPARLVVPGDGERQLELHALRLQHVVGLRAVVGVVDGRDLLLVLLDRQGVAQAAWRVQGLLHVQAPLPADDGHLELRVRGVLVHEVFTTLFLEPLLQAVRGRGVGVERVRHGASRVFKRWKEDASS